MTEGPTPLPPKSHSENKLLDYVRPVDWHNPEPRNPYDLVIVGAGPAGLAAADLAIRLGLRVALIERNRLGGNSLNAGTVPSKAIIHAAHAYAAKRQAEEFYASGFTEPGLNFGAVMARMARLRTRIAEYHSAGRLQTLGVDLFFGDARFSGPSDILIGGTRLHFRKALVATGARPKPSNISGLDQVGYHTSESIFELEELPKRLVVIGGGPLGCEVAQAYCRLGAHVTIVQNDPKFLPREERDAAETLSRSMARDGVVIRLNTTVVGARLQGGTKCLDTLNNEVKDCIEADVVLLSIGRVPNTEALGLDIAGIECDGAQGITVDDFLCTTNENVYAAGDVCASDKFTNVARSCARMAVQNALAGKEKRQSQLTIPWCTYCDPEIAHIGLHAWEAKKKSIPAKSFTVMMHDVDRAILDGQDSGYVKIHVKEGTDTILGATIVASRASEMINEISVAMSAGLGMRELSRVLHTYPAQSEAIRMAALAYCREAAFS